MLINLIGGHTLFIVIGFQNLKNNFIHSFLLGIYQCSCNNLMDADYNASINILHRGIYSSSNKENQLHILQ